MTKELKDTIRKAGFVITTLAVGGTGGYFLSETTPQEIIVEKPIFNYWGDEGRVVMEVYNAMLQDKKDNCEAEADCVIDEGIPKVVFENITSKDEVPAKIKEKLGEYNIKVEKK